MPERARSFVIFSDDWGRHPSSCQHIVRHWLVDHSVLWVNTIGMRPPSFNFATLKRAAEKLTQWSTTPDASHALPETLDVTNPKMWPWFRSRRDQKLNHRLLRAQLIPKIRQLPRPTYALTTVPITADLISDLPVSHWTYYCVDDFSVWPGLDGSALRQMDERQMRSVDELVVVSDTLSELAESRGRTSRCLTHGVDVAHFANACSEPRTRLPSEIEPPIFLFWGVIDQRLDDEFVASLSAQIDSGTIVFVGPTNAPLPNALNLPNVRHLPPVSFELLPSLAAQSDVLIMPYADLPVTRAMQPLKLKEYMATNLPVVVRRLPSTQPWGDCLDVAQSASEFARLAQLRSSTGVPVPQLQARRRLSHETWEAKSAQLLGWINRDAKTSCAEEMQTIAEGEQYR